MSTQKEGRKWGKIE